MQHLSPRCSEWWHCTDKVLISIKNFKDTQLFSPGEAAAAADSSAALPSLGSPISQAITNYQGAILQFKFQQQVAPWKDGVQHLSFAA